MMSISTDFDLRAIKATDDKDREFVLIIRNENLPPCQKGWQETSVPMSKGQVREALLRLQVPETNIDEEITTARSRG
jgi:hypothetical protein